MCDSRGAEDCADGSCLRLSEAAATIDHGLELARLALAGPDPEIAAMYLADAVEAAREDLAASPP